jgi:hypothetical protein
MNVTSYVYEANSSALTPSVVFSNLSILPNGTPGFGVSSNVPWMLLGAMSLTFGGIF